MGLQVRIKKDLMASMKARDEDRKNTLRVVMGEFARMDKKEVSDDEVIKVLKKLVKSEREVLEKKGETGGSAFISIIESYLPRMASDDEIKEWIGGNVDFSKFKNKMQAMGQVMKHFGSTADGARVREIMQGL